MNKKIKISILLLTLQLLISPVFGQQIFDNVERQPFDSPTWILQSNQISRAPGLGGAGGPGIPPPTEEDKVGAPIEDVFWLLPMLAIGYGIIRRKIRTKN